ncbi:desulfoferrodoxin FeS4 iron-binding domain-containing protein [Eubacteriales bacterium OttesenSCG-928-M02]|nr:desulfoferrodoxin FeS4 iron-binding domain-containing protein [Eubacteriales bacterium OttesenSCG-928-M02]
MMKEVKYFRCTVCGNLVEKIIEGVGTMVCCNQDMVLLEANVTDGATEKHVPAVTIENGVVTAVVGEVEHPMLPEHYIQFISIVTEDGIYRKDLKPGDAPKVELTTDAKVLEVYEYCNLHGLWKIVL